MIRDPFGDPAAGNPMEAARRGARPALIKRFYKEASVGERAGAFAILLDGKPAKTPAKHAARAARAARWPRRWRPNGRGRASISIRRRCR